ncbi:MAG: heavy metal translocating P-type ATPase, partial [Candidatus Saccharimonadales bacterium]
MATAASAIGLIFQFTGPVAITHWLLGLVALALTIKLIINMWRSLRDGSYGIDLLAATAIITAVILHEYWVGIVIVLMLTGGEALEDYAENRAQVELKSLLSHAPHRAHVIRRGKSVDLPIAEVRIGDKVIIKPGEVVPVDAIILEGMSSFNESSITGESLPELKQVGADILSGSVNLDGIITAKALRAAADSQYEQIIKLVRSASHSKAPFVRMADRYAIPFTIIAFAIAGGIWLWSGEAIRFLEVLVVATPCPLILAAPIAIISGMSRASKAGIIVKNGGALERLAKIKSIAFDKTGTLTHGELKVTGVKTFGKFTTAEVMGYAASAEKGSTHALSSAIIQHAEQLKTKTFKVKSLRESSGLGIIAYTNAQTVLVGRADLLSENGIEVPKSVIESNVTGTRTFVALNNQLAGIISFEDALRSDSKATINQMRRNHVKDIYLITGDNLASAKNVAKQVGIDIKQVIANALP